MDNVIGYKGSAETRKMRWLVLKELKLRNELSLFIKYLKGYYTPKAA